MNKIEFYDYKNINNEEIYNVVIFSRYQGKWIYCQRKDRETWEMPGGRREPGENIIKTAERELYEETGALKFTLTPVCCYKNNNSWGLLCFSEIEELGEIPNFEMLQTKLFDSEPGCLTYPEIQKELTAKIYAYLNTY